MNHDAIRARGGKNSFSRRVTGWKVGIIAGVIAVVATPCHLEAADAPEAEPGPREESPLAAPATQPIDVNPTAADEKIAARLAGILTATEWFENPQVRVQAGVVFLQGVAPDERQRDWATQLAGNMQGAVAVVNQMQLVPRSVWDLSETWREIGTLLRQAVRHSPLVLIALGLLVASWLFAAASSRAFRAAMRRRWKNALLRAMIANAIGVLVFVLGLYFVLRVAGLTRLAVTVLGGTGLMGLVIGFAFRDIAENFLASLLMSIQRPFQTGDLIEVAGIKGYVQQVNARSTLLMTLDGNHVQIPNATVYKGTITNFWANPQVRCTFAVGVGYDDSITRAQEIGMDVMRRHPAVLATPEPSVLVENLGAATVNLRFWFWINLRTHSEAKVTSAVIRLTKRAYQSAGVSLPDEARELVFPQGVPVELVDRRSDVAASHPPRPRPAAQAAPVEAVDAANDAEDGLCSEAESIQSQARNSRNPEGGRNLLDADATDA